MNAVSVLEPESQLSVDGPTTFQKMAHLGALFMALPMANSIACYEQAPSLNTDVAIASDQTTFTRGSLSVVQVDLDAALANELVRFADNLVSSQVELEQRAKHVLYSRMRELYRR